MTVLVDNGHGRDNSEVWRDIPGWEGLYQVSSIGRVKALTKTYVICNSSVVTKKEKILRTRPMRDGYRRIELNHNGESRSYPVHRLVAMAFIDNPDNKPHIDHINTIRDDRDCGLYHIPAPSALIILFMRKRVLTQNPYCSTISREILYLDIRVATKQCEGILVITFLILLALAAVNV